jgi:hypothetical protein
MSHDDDDRIELELDLEEPIQFAKKNGLARIEELLKQSAAALAEAKKIADEEGLTFTLNEGEISATYRPGYGYEQDHPDHWEPSMIC